MQADGDRGLPAVQGVMLEADGQDELGEEFPDDLRLAPVAPVLDRQGGTAQPLPVFGQPGSQGVNW